VGGAVLDLIGGGQLVETTDIDFVIKNKQLGETFQRQGFVKSNFIGGLYTQYRGIDSTHIDIKETDVHSPEQGDWLIHDAFKRDFTICALFCGREGQVLDPTGKGIDDAKNNCLRTIVNAKLSLHHDPVRVLRAIKYISRGFVPTLELDSALKEWVPENNIDIGHMLAVVQGQLNAKNAGKYLEILQEYGLMEKLNCLFSQNGVRQFIGNMLETRPSIHNAHRWLNPPQNSVLFSLGALRKNPRAHDLPKPPARTSDGLGYLDLELKFSRCRI